VDLIVVVPTSTLFGRFVLAQVVDWKLYSIKHF